MRGLVRSLRPSHALMLGGVALWGVIEFVALNRPHPGRQRDGAQPESGIAACRG